MQIIFLGILAGSEVIVLKGLVFLLVVHTIGKWWSDVQENRKKERDTQMTYFADNVERRKAKAMWSRAYAVWSGRRRPENAAETRWKLFPNEFAFRLAAIQFYEETGNPALISEAWNEFGAWVSTKETADKKAARHVLHVQDTVTEANQSVANNATEWELVEDNSETNSMGWAK